MGPHDDDRWRAAVAGRPRGTLAEVLGGQPATLPGFDMGPKAQMVSAIAIAPVQVEWLWPDRIPLGTLTLFSGDPKLGKSLAAIAVLAAVTRGGPLPGGEANGPAVAPRGSAILLSAEDDPARTIVPRLRAAGADLERVHVLATMVDSGFHGLAAGPRAHAAAGERMPTLSAEDLEVIERRAAALGDCRLIVFDPISAYVDGRNSDVRRALAPLRDMAARLGAAIVLITHHGKHGASGTNGKYRVLGSIAYVGVCRANFLFLQDPDDPTGRRRLMLDNGGNLAPRQPALPYVIRDNDAAPFCDWLPETIELDADAALARAVKAGKIGASSRLARRHECQQWLRGYLANEPRSARECEHAALAAGFNSHILERARADLAIRSLRSGFGKGACYQWCLPDTVIESSDGGDRDDSGHAPQ